MDVGKIIINNNEWYGYKKMNIFYVFKYNVIPKIQLSTCQNGKKIYNYNKLNDVNVIKNKDSLYN